MAPRKISIHRLGCFTPLAFRKNRDKEVKNAGSFFWFGWRRGEGRGPLGSFTKPHFFLKLFYRYERSSRLLHRVDKKI
jgi:hypothetical protein